MAYVCNRLKKASRQELELLSTDPEFEKLFWENENRLVRRPAEEGGFWYWISNYGSYRPPEGGQIQPLDVWEFQRDQLIPALIEEKEIVVGKGRRLGISTISLHWAYWLCNYAPGKEGFQALFFSKKGDDAKKLIRAIRQIHSQIPDPLRAPIGSEAKDSKGDVGVDTTEEVSFPARDAIISSFPASGDSGRGLGAGLIFLDEIAHVKGSLDTAEELFTSVDQVREGAFEDGQIIIASTANGKVGRGKFFWDMWERAASGKSGFKALFFPWSVRPGRTSDWYERKKRAHKDEFKFRQENPSTPDEMFMGASEGLAYPLSGVHAAIVKGEQIYREIVSGAIEEPSGRTIDLGIDLGGHSVSVVVWDLGSNNYYIAAENYDDSSDPATFFTNSMNQGESIARVEEVAYDALGVGLSSIRTFRSLYPRTRRYAVKFNKTKYATYGFLKMLLNRTADGEKTGTIAISPDCKHVILELQQIQIDENGKIKKGDDHAHDALLVGLTKRGLLWDKMVARARVASGETD